MPHATAPTSFLLCLLPGASKADAEELAGLLTDPILVSYPVAARDYLEGALSRLSGPARNRVERVLAEHSAYLLAIEAVGYIPELQPSGRQRWLEHRRQDEAFQRAGREAEAASDLISLFGKQLLLHGVSTISYVDDSGGGTRRLENRLGTITHTADNAMGWIYDPCGLDYMLRVFRTVRPPA